MKRKVMKEIILNDEEEPHSPVHTAPPVSDVLVKRPRGRPRKTPKEEPKETVTKELKETVTKELKETESNSKESSSKESSGKEERKQSPKKEEPSVGMFTSLWKEYMELQKMIETTRSKNPVHIHVNKSGKKKKKPVSSDDEDSDSTAYQTQEDEVYSPPKKTRTKPGYPFSKKVPTIPSRDEKLYGMIFKRF